jgi:hypothetical protein
MLEARLSEAKPSGRRCNGSGVGGTGSGVFEMLGQGASRPRRQLERFETGKVA